MRFWKLATLTFGLVLGLAFAQEEPLKAGFIYVGPIGDYGWSHAHNEARLAAEEALPWLETTFVESVPEGQEATFIDQMVRGGADVIFTTSFGYMDGTLAAAERYPDVIFAHASGFKRAPNMATYMADFYQVYYLNGLLAGALTETNKAGYVGAFPIPEVKRHLGAFALGMREVNPEATVQPVWINAWFDPARAAEATQALIAEGADVFAFTEDTPTVVQVAAQQGLPSFAHYSPMLEYAPTEVVSGQLVNWEKIYIDFLQKVHDGVYTNENLENVDYWWLLPEDAVEAGASYDVVINPVFEDALKAKVVDHPEFGEISVYDLHNRRLEGMSAAPVAFDPFTGPLEDRQGNLVVPEGETMTQAELTTMEWAAPGVVGSWPNEP